MKTEIVILGAGGHAKVLADVLLALEAPLLGFVDEDRSKTGQSILGLPVLGTDEWILKKKPSEILLVNGIGSIEKPLLRRKIFEKFKNLGYRFAQVVHPSVLLGREVVLGEGVQLMAGAILQTGCRVGDNAIINTRAALDHDCEIGSHSHLAPGTTLSGGVRIGESCHVGTGASIIQGRQIGDRCVVGAGAVVIENAQADTTVVGVPAKEVNL